MKKDIYLAALLVLIFSSLALAGTTGTMQTFKDRSGNVITVTKPFKRIISLYGAHTENLFSLGLDKEIIGVSRHEAFPPKVTSKPVFSYHDDPEKFIAAHPDLVLIRPMIAQGYPNLVLKLQQSGITVVSLQPRTVDDMYAYWLKLGLLTGRYARANEMVREFRDGVNKIKSMVKDIPPRKRKRVFFEAIHSKMKTFAPHSIAMFALRVAGGINVARDAIAHRNTNIANYGKERILKHADEIDVYLAQRGAMNRITVRRIKEEPGFSAIKAVKKDQIYIIDEKIVSRPTMRLLDGIYEIGRILYPDKFNKIDRFLKIAVLNRSDFAEMFVKMMNIRLKTPDYRHDILHRRQQEHRYGDFKDVDYMGKEYKFIETAVSRGLFPHVEKYHFYPERPVDRQTLAFAIFVCFDLPEANPVKIKDVSTDNPFFNQIQAVVGLHIMSLDREGRFNPKGSVSGLEVLKAVKKAKEKSL